MALQVGELFASFEMDISGAQAALQRIETQWQALGNTLAAPGLEALGERALAGLTGWMNEKQGAAAAEALASGLEQGARAGQGGAASALRALALACLESAAGTLSPAAGSRIGGLFIQGMAAGMEGMRDRMMAAAGTVGEAAAAALRQAVSLPAGRTAGQLTAESGSRMTDGRDNAAVYAGAVAAALRGMTVQMDGQAVGMLVTPTVSRNIAMDAALRRVGG